MRPSLSQRLWRVLFWFGVALATVLALGPGLGPALPPVEGQDKVQHAAAFVALAFAAALAYPAPAGAQRGRDARIAAALLGYGVAIELAQGLIPSRTASAADVVADGAGVLLGLLLARLWRRWRPGAPGG